MKSDNNAQAYTPAIIDHDIAAIKRLFPRFELVKVKEFGYERLSVQVCNLDLENIAETAFSHSLHPVTALLVRAIAQLRLGLYHECIENFTSVINSLSRPSSAGVAHFLRGLAYDLLDNLPNALESYTATLQVHPHHRWCIHNRAILHNRLGRFQEGINDYLTALEPEPAPAPRLSALSLSPFERLASVVVVALGLPRAAACSRAGSAPTSGSVLQEASPSRLNSPPGDRLDGSASSDVDPLCRLSRPVPLFSSAAAACDWFEELQSPRDGDKLASSNSGARVLSPTAAARQSVPLEDGARGGGRRAGDSDGVACAAADDEADPSAAMTTGGGADAADALHREGFAARKRGDYAAAITAYTHCLAVNPRHFKALFNRGYCYDRIGAVGRAVCDYTAALALLPTSAYTHYNLGIALDRAGRHAQAVEMFTAALKLEPNNADFAHNRGFSRRKLGDYRGAIEDYTRALSIQPQHFKALYNRAFSRDKLGDYRGAICDYTAAIRLDDTSVNAYHNRATSYEQLGDLEAAIADFTVAIQMDSSNASTLNSRGLVHDRMGNFSAAVADFTAAIERQRGDAATASPEQATGAADDLVRTLRDVDAAAGKHGPVVSTLDDVSLTVGGRSVTDIVGTDFLATAAVVPTHDDEGMPSEPRLAAGVYLHNRGFAHRNAGDFEAAVRDFSASVEVDPGCASAWSNRAFSLRKLGRYDEAAADYSAALRLTPSSSRCLNNRAYCHARMGRYRAAVEDYSGVIELEPDNAHALHNRGIALGKIGQHAQAASDFAAAEALGTRGRGASAASGPNANAPAGVGPVSPVRVSA